MTFTEHHCDRHVPYGDLVDEALDRLPAPHRRPGSLSPADDPSPTRLPMVTHRSRTHRPAIRRRAHVAHRPGRRRGRPHRRKLDGARRRRRLLRTPPPSTAHSRAATTGTTSRPQHGAPSSNGSCPRRRSRPAAAALTRPSPTPPTAYEPTSGGNPRPLTRPEQSRCTLALNEAQRQSRLIERCQRQTAGARVQVSVNRSALVAGARSRLASAPGLVDDADPVKPTTDSRQETVEGW